MTQKGTQKCRHCGLPIEKVEVSKKWMWFHSAHGWAFCRNEDTENHVHDRDYKSKFVHQQATPHTFKDYVNQAEML